MGGLVTKIKLNVIKQRPSLQTLRQVIFIAVAMIASLMFNNVFASHRHAHHRVSLHHQRAVTKTSSTPINGLGLATWYGPANGIASATSRMNNDQSLAHAVSYVVGRQTQQGVASWYGPGFHRHKTASGERYNMFDMTAASRTLPLLSYARVTNLRTGRQITVKINDRGPYVGHRIIDLSFAAAQQLGIVGQGTAMVKVEQVRHPDESSV